METGGGLKVQVPHQPDASGDQRNTIRLLPGKNLELALCDLEGIDRIWLLWWFHKNQTWRPRVLPPRGSPIRRGVFATRSPHRPNPLGLTAVRLYRVEGLELEVGALDLIEGTPILDIKPYIAGVDAFPDSSAGWIDELEFELAQAPKYSVIWSDQAAFQIQSLEARGMDLQQRAVEILQRDPSPHRTRRILKLKDGTCRLACGRLRFFFVVEGQTVTILSVSAV